jgi:hypothetical protein
MVSLLLALYKGVKNDSQEQALVSAPDLQNVIPHVVATRQARRSLQIGKQFMHTFRNHFYFHLIRTQGSIQELQFLLSDASGLNGANPLA